jgi:hypothetical protein
MDWAAFWAIFFTTASGHPVIVKSRGSRVLMPTFEKPNEKCFCGNSNSFIFLNSILNNHKTHSTQFTWSQSCDRELQRQRCKFLQRHG